MTTLPTSPPRALAVKGGPAHGEHPVVLGGFAPVGSTRSRVPLIVERRDQDFLDGLLADLGDRSRHAELLKMTPVLQEDGRMRLFQPLQRVFNLAVVEAWCEVPGKPRIDPARIDSAGMVVRRIARDDGVTRLAWLRAGTRVIGWVAVDEDLDPAHDLREPAVHLGHPALDALAPSQRRVLTAGSARMAASRDPVGEDVTPLFVAAPAVCAGAAKTLLFGVLRLSPGELSDEPPQPASYGSDDAEKDLLREHLVPYLQKGGPYVLPRLRVRDLDANQIRAAAALDSGDIATAPLSREDYDELASKVIPLLRQLHVEFDAFDGVSAAAVELRAQLAKLRIETEVPAAGGSGVQTMNSGAWPFLVDAKAVLLDVDQTTVDPVTGAIKAVTWPTRFCKVDATLAKSIFDATLACLSVQSQKVVGAKGRFDKGSSGQADPTFVVRAFVRLKPEQAGCTGRLLWSDYSPPFTIAPWYESSGAPVPVIPMPDLTDRSQLNRVKPTVAFSLPPKLAFLLNNMTPKNMLLGKGSTGDGLGLAWVCSFSLPIITLCAFIVLHIFLILFNLIFFWLPFLKICLPLPKVEPPDLP